MRARAITSFCSFSLTLLIGFAALRAGPAYAQQFGIDLNTASALNANAVACLNQSLAPGKRISSCTGVIDMEPNTTRVAGIYVARAEAYQEEGDNRAALRDLDKAASRDPKNELPWIGLGNLYMATSAYSKALESYDHAVKLAGRNPVVYDARGGALVALGRYDEAIADFTSALALDRQDPTALSDRAYAYLASNRPKPAIADFTDVIRAEPTNAMAFYNRGTAYERTQELDKAEDDYRNALRLKPSFALAHESIGRVLERTEPEAAIAQLNEAIRLDPRSSALKVRANLYLSSGRFDAAVRDLDQVIANDGSDHIAYLNRGVAEQNLGNFNAALADYSRSIELDTTTAALVDRGNVYMRLREPERALGDFDAALAIDAKNPAALVGRAEAHYTPNKRDPERLAMNLDEYNRAIEAAPDNPAAYFTRGNIHFDLRDYAGAYRDYSASLKLNPNQPEALFNRSLAAEHLGRSVDAARDRNLAGKLDRSIGTRAPSDSLDAEPAAQVEYAAPQVVTTSPQIHILKPKNLPTDKQQTTSKPQKDSQ